MQNDTQVSIIMPSFNAAVTIGESIESIMSQTYNDWELLISDDGSTDDTIAIVEAYAQKDRRIKLYKLKGNSGAGVARNNSIKNAKGRYLAFCDSDDMWMPAKLERQMEFMKANGYQFVFASYLTCNKEGKVNGRITAPAKVSLDSNKNDNRIGFLTAIYDTKTIGKLYMPTLRKRQDWAYGLEILKRCQYAYALKEPLAIYRRGMRGAISHNKFSLLKYNAQVYETVFGYSKPHAYLRLFFIFLPLYMVKRLKRKKL